MRYRSSPLISLVGSLNLQLSVKIAGSRSPVMKYWPWERFLERMEAICVGGRLVSLEEVLAVEEGGDLPKGARGREDDGGG